MADYNFIFGQIVDGLHIGGLAFERVGLWHIEQIKKKLGIIDLCEMKYCKDQYTISSGHRMDLRHKKRVFQNVTGTVNAVHTVMVTTEGVKHNAEWGEIQAEVTLDDLFE